jgi:hypothetical protein
MIHYAVAATNNTCMKEIIRSKKERIIAITSSGPTADEGANINCSKKRKQITT